MRYFSVLIALLLLTLAPGALRAESLLAVKAEGVAAKSANLVDVKKRALDQALKNAVLSAAEGLEGKDAVAKSLKTSINASPQSFVRNYRILAEGWINHMEDAPVAASDSTASSEQTPGATELFHIWIEASVDSAELRRQIARQSAGGSTASTVRINIVDLTDYAEYKTLLESLRRTGVVQDLSDSAFSGGRIELTARVSGNAETLSGKVAKEVSDRFMVITNGSNELIIRPARGSSR